MEKVMIFGVVLIIFVLAIVGCTKVEVTTTTQAPAQAPAEVTGKAVQPVGNCEDSDGGIMAERAGSVGGVIDGEEYVYYDKCFPPSSILIEYYCENGEVKNQNIRCPSGTRCLGGACRKL